jgi:hypothetical protein
MFIDFTVFDSSVKTSSTGFDGAASGVPAFAGGGGCKVHTTGPETEEDHTICTVWRVSGTGSQVWRRRPDSVLPDRTHTVCLSVSTSVLLLAYFFYCVSRIRTECFIACSCVQKFDKWSCYPFLNLSALLSSSRVSKLVFLNSLEKIHWIYDSFPSVFHTLQAIRFNVSWTYVSHIHKNIGRTNTEIVPVGPIGSPSPEIGHKTWRNWIKVPILLWVFWIAIS